MHLIGNSFRRNAAPLCLVIFSLLSFGRLSLSGHLRAVSAFVKGYGLTNPFTIRLLRKNFRSRKIL